MLNVAVQMDPIASINPAGDSTFVPGSASAIASPSVLPAFSAAAWTSSRLPYAPCAAMVPIGSLSPKRLWYSAANFSFVGFLALSQ